MRRPSTITTGTGWAAGSLRVESRPVGAAPITPPDVDRTRTPLPRHSDTSACSEAAYCLAPQLKTLCFGGGGMFVNRLALVWRSVWTPSDRGAREGSSLFRDRSGQPGRAAAMELWAWPTKVLIRLIRRCLSAIAHPLAASTCPPSAHHHFRTVPPYLVRRSSSSSSASRIEAATCRDGIHTVVISDNVIDTIRH